MTQATEMCSARSWLFAPGDSEKKMTKAAASNADIALIDLEDAVATGEKANARALTAAFLKAQADTSRLWVRINPLDSEYALADLAAVMPGKPGGIMLPKSRGRDDLVVLDHYLLALEAANGIEPRSEEHTSELQSLMRLSYAVFCLKKTHKQFNLHSTLKYV